MPEDVLVWRGHPVDLLEAETVRRLEAATCGLRAGAGEGIEGVCGRLRAFFDALLGPEAGAQLLPKDNLRDAMALYADFLAFGQRQRAQVQAWAVELLTEYDPAQLEG